MIAHLVLMNLRDLSDGPFVADQIRSLCGQIPGLQRVEGGTSVVDAPATWDLGFLMVFTTPESVTTYQSHSAHVEVASQIRDLIRQMATCDITVDLAAISKPPPR